MIINSKELAIVLKEIAEVFSKYNLNDIEIKFIIGELKEISEIGERRKMDFIRDITDRGIKPL